MDRRQLLAGFALAGVTAACASTSEESGTESNTGGGGGTDGTTTGRTVTAAGPAPATLAPAAFGLGVASGDPLSDRVMLWTRLATAPGAVGVDGVNLAPATPPPAADGTVEVAFDVATDEEFTDLVASGIAIATPELGHSVHVDVSGLEPDTWYFYRFRAGDQTSAVGRTRTFPDSDASPERFRFVFASCQDFQWGFYGAWGRAAELPGVDAVVFLGDYVYEATYGDLSPDKSGARVWATSAALGLDDYRSRYAQTKADPQLQAAHQMAPWIVTFDDHEVSDNYAHDVGQADVNLPDSRDRRLAAYQAWYEHTPIRIDPLPGDEPAEFDELRVFRDFSFGSLARVFTLETRQHADPPPCRAGGDLTSDDGPGCDEMFGEARTNLGDEQESWLVEGLGASDASWNILANPLMFAGLEIGTVDEIEYTRDTWDGYPASRRRIIDAITTSEVKNPVVVTGDWHASFVLDVKERPGDATSATVMPEFLASSISTILFPTDYSANNPQVRYFVAEHGYALVTVTPADLTCEFHYVADEWDPATPISHIDTWRVLDGEHEAQAV